MTLRSTHRQTDLHLRCIGKQKVFTSKHSIKLRWIYIGMWCLPMSRIFHNNVFGPDWMLFLTVKPTNIHISIMWLWFYHYWIQSQMCNILNTFVAIKLWSEKNMYMHASIEKSIKFHCYMTASMISLEHNTIDVRYARYACNIISLIYPLNTWHH